MKMDKLDSFINSRRQNRNTGRNRLLPYKEEIEYLYKKGMGYKDIALYLKTEEQVEVATNTIGAFCRKHFTDANSTLASTKPEPEITNKILLPTKKESSKSEAQDNEKEVPQHKRLASWANIPGVKSIDDLY